MILKVIIYTKNIKKISYKTLMNKLKIFKALEVKFSSINPIYLKINSNYLKVCFLKCEI